MKFLQIHSFYEKYLADFYHRNLHMATAPFEEQIEALLQNGFAAGHMFAPYLREFGYDTQLIIANCLQAQTQWARENGMTHWSQKDWRLEIARRQVEAFKPDILHLGHPIDGFDSNFLRALTWKPSLILAWRGAAISPKTDWSMIDVLLSSFASCREKALALGAKSTDYFFPGFPQFLAEACSNQPQEWDVVFSGQWTREHVQRNALLQEVAKAARSRGKAFSIGYFIAAPQPENLPAEVARHNHGPRWAIEMCRALKSGRIVLNASIDYFHEEAPNMRLFEATGAGAFLLTEHQPNIQKFFEPGVEIETFRDSGELIEKIYYYLEHSEKREAIARRGHERCRREYSMSNRAKEFDALIRKHLARKYPSFNMNIKIEKSEPIGKLMDQAAQALQSDQNEKAFELLIQAKALKQPRPGLDYLRAVCFLKLNRPQAGREALREELRFFPDNGEARKLLDEIFERSPQTVSGKIKDDEFNELLAVVRAYTMLGEDRLYSLFTRAKQICLNDLPGNFVECGVAAGGSTALLSYVVKRYSKRPRWVYALDSFSGMPAPTAHDHHRGTGAEETGWGTGTCAAPEESVKEICVKLEVSGLVKTVKGYFQNTLPAIRDEIGEISLLHLDADWYESTLTILDNLFDQVVENGILQVDDYGHWEGCRKALHEFEAQRQLEFSIHKIDYSGVWFFKPEMPSHEAIVRQPSTIKVLHIIQRLSTGGAARAMLAAAKYSAQLDNYAHGLISLLPPDPEGLKLAQEFGIALINASDREAILREIERADLVQVHWWNNPELDEFLRSELPPMRLLMWMHVAGDQAPHVITKELIDFADMALACSPYTYEHAVFQNLPPEARARKTGMVYAGADFERLAGVAPQPHANFNVGYIGTVDFVKMHPRYVAMSAAIDIPNVRFIVCGGKGVSDLLLRQAHMFGAAEHFEFRGYVSDLRSVFETLDVFGYPLCEETYAAAELTLQETMYAGIPPVVFPYGGVKLLVMNDETGLVVHSEREYKRAIEYLYHHPQERERLGRNAKEYARRIFGAENAAKRLNAIYQKMMQDPKRPRHWEGRSARNGSSDSPERLKKSAKLSGAQIFSESVAEVKPCFAQSMTAQDLPVLLAAEREIALSPPVLRSAGGGGILHYRKHYPNDGFLRLWSGLILHQGGQYVEAASEYAAAMKLGCKHWRLAWYLAQAAEQAGDIDAAQQALRIVLQAAPDFVEARAMAQRLAQLTFSVSKNITALTSTNGATKKPGHSSSTSERFQRLVTEASALLDD